MLFIMKKSGVAILSTLGGTVIGVAAGIAGMSKVMEKGAEGKQAVSDKFQALFLMMNQWVKVKQEGKQLSSYFDKNGYKKIAVYGMSHVGETLLEELKDSNIQVAYAIDRNASRLYADIDIVTLDDSLDKVDAIIVTAITFFDEIEEQLSTRVDCPIISLEDVLYEV